MNTNITILFFSLLGAAAPVHAQVADSGAFFVRLGKDTIAVERYVRTSHSLKAEAALRTPQTRAYKLDITFRDNGEVSWYAVQNDPVQGVPNASPVMRSVTTYDADSATVQAWYAAQLAPTRRIAANPGMIPLQLPFYSTIETALIRARKASTDTATMTMLSANGPLTYSVRFGARDSVELVQPGAGTIHARMNRHGQLLALDGGATTFKVVVTRAKWLDIDPYLKRYAAAEAAGKAIGPLSPRDSAVGRVGKQTEVVVGYGRPSKRGRVTFGGIVPWGEVWRTGANAATSISFADTVVVAGATVPPGKYSLWTVPQASGPWQLILNRRTGQWGTSYDPAQDLVRVAVKTESAPVPLDRFTIDFKDGAGGVTIMRMMWDRTRVLVPIRNK